MWWLSHKLIVTTWNEFCQAFKDFYGTIYNKDEARAKLYSKQQGNDETFMKFAYKTLAEYLQVNPNSTKEEVMEFVINHSHTSIRPSLMSSQPTFTKFEDMVTLGIKLEKNRDLQSKYKTTEPSYLHTSPSNNYKGRSEGKFKSDDKYINNQSSHHSTFQNSTSPSTSPSPSTIPSFSRSEN